MKRMSKIRSAKKQVYALRTAFGPRRLYESVSYCNRCGMCAPVCPIYQLRPRETASPRGRNQLLRLILERHIAPSPTDPTQLFLLRSCTLCGRCQTTCAGGIPTAEHVLELRRALQLRVLPRLLHTFLQWHGTRPHVFAGVARTALLLRRLGGIKLLRMLGITRLDGLKWLSHLDDILPPDAAEWKGFPSARNAACIYLPSLEAQWILPQLAKQTCERLPRPLAVWHHTASGLFEYVYGDLRQSRRLLRRLITRHARTGKGNVPLVTDSVDVYYFLTHAEQVLSGSTQWEKKAKKFAACIHFVTAFIRVTPPEQPLKERVQLEYGALFTRQGEPFAQAGKILSTLFGPNFVECSYTDTDIPAFGYSLTAGNYAAEIGFKTVTKIARTKTKTVFTLSGLAALELNYYLKQFYPAAQAAHIASVNR